MAIFWWGVDCRWGRQKSRSSANIWLSNWWMLELVHITVDCHPSSSV